MENIDNFDLSISDLLRSLRTDGITPDFDTCTATDARQSWKFLLLSDAKSFAHTLKAAVMHSTMDDVEDIASAAVRVLSVSSSKKGDAWQHVNLGGCLLDLIDREVDLILCQNTEQWMIDCVELHDEMGKA